MLPVMEKLCECGCGGLAPIAKRNNKNRGYVRGQPMRFIRGHSARKSHGLEPCRDPEWSEYLNDPNRFWYAGRWMTLESIENERASQRESRRRKRGIHQDAPLMPLSQRGSLGNRIRKLRKAVANHRLMNIMDREDPERVRLMRLCVDPSASPFEGKLALKALDRHIDKQKGKSPWQQTTSNETQTQRLLPRSA